MEHASIWLLVGVALTALVYSMVGHGGASGYLGLLALSSMLPRDVAITALVINLAVAGTSFVFYKLARHFSWSFAWPFLAGSVPLAFLGSRLILTAPIYYWLVGGLLIFSGVRLLWATPAPSQVDLLGRSSAQVRFSIGAGIGLMSGMVGVGGGIFLSPVLLLARWATAKQASAVSAIFIVANSAAGLIGRFQQGGSVQPVALGLVFAGFVGAFTGSYLGAFGLGQRTLQRVLASVLVFAALKLILSHRLA